MSTHETGVPSPALWLPKVSVPSYTASLSSWCVTMYPPAWRMRQALPSQRTDSDNGFPSYPPPPPLSLAPFAVNGQTEPRTEAVGDIPSLPSYLSQFQEHKDVPIDVHHHLSCFHQPGHCVLLCDTHSRKSAKEPHEGICTHVHPQTGAHCRAKRDQGQGQVSTGQERPQAI